MYDTSYLFSRIPENAHSIYFTMSNNAITKNCLYLIESEDLEAIEPEWVKHNECFVGRLLSTNNDGLVTSAHLPTYNSVMSQDGYYKETNMSSESLCG